MATTIITKSGSGAPLAGDLQVAELALDLTNKKLYSKEGTTVFEVGATGGGASGTFTDLTATNSFTSVGIDDNATSTAITIDASENVGIGTASPLSKLEVLDTSGPVITLNRNDTTIATDDVLGSIEFYDADGGSGSAGVTSAIKSLATGSNGASVLTLSTSNSSGGARAALAEAVRIDNAGSVGIGTTSPSKRLHIDTATNGGILLEDSANSITGIFYSSGSNSLALGSTSNHPVKFFTNNSERMRLDASGNLGIGTTSPSSYSFDNGPEVVIGDGTDNPHLSIVSLTTGTGYVAFADGTTGNEKYRGLIEYAHTTDHMGLRTGGTERMRIDSSGNVGIGGSPVSSIRRLMVTDTGDVRVDIRSGSDTNLGAIDFSDTSNTARGQLIYDHNDDSMQFKTLSTERMRITSDGNVWIGGTFAANSQLAVSKGTAAGLEVICERTVGGTVDTGAVRFLSYDRTGLAFTDLAYDAAEHIFGNGSTERMRIDSSGNLLVGTTTASEISAYPGGVVSKNSNVPFVGYRPTGNVSVSLLAVASDVGSSKAVKFSVLADGDVLSATNSYGSLSDERLKSNIVDASSQIDDIMAVQVRSYTLNATGDTHIGVVAQELEASGMSGLVQEDEEGMKSVKYSVLYMKAIKALQEAVTRIETLEAEVAALKGA